MQNKRKGVLKRAIVTPDKHVPLHDKKACNVVLKAIEIVKPDIYIDLGDLGEWASVSHWQWKRKKKPPVEYIIPKVEKDIADVNKQVLISASETKVEDDTLIIASEEETEKASDSIPTSFIDDDSVKGLYTNIPFKDGYVGYYHYYPKENIYMTGKKLTNQSVPIGTTKHKFNSPSYKKALKKIYNKIAINNNIRRKTKGVSLDKQVEKVKPKTMKPLIKKQKITKGGKY